MKHFKNYINGEWILPKSDKWLENINPATGDAIGKFPLSNYDDVNAAAEAAKAAQPQWRNMPSPKRAEYICKAVDFLKENKERFAIDLCEEMGKTLPECRGDLQETIDMALYCAGEGRRNFGLFTSSEFQNRMVLSYREPIGVVGAITPWNYPTAMPAWKIMPALITGNCVVLKPAEDTPKSAVNLLSAFENAGLPKGVLNLVMGNGETTGDAIVNHRLVNLISFTGSTKTGTEIARKCANYNKRVALEMGGKNAMIILSDADPDNAANETARAIFATAGQRCASAGRVIVEEAIAIEFTEKLIEQSRKWKLGNGMDENTDIGPLINKKQLHDIHDFVIRAKSQGGKIICGGKIADDKPLRNGYFYEPTLIGNVTPDMEISQKEVFGPVAVILTVKNIDEAIKVANDVEYGLTSGVCTQDIDKAMHVAREIEVGSFFVNTACVGAEIHLPFGGMKNSGNGQREGNSKMLDIYSEWKTVSIQQNKSF